MKRILPAVFTLTFFARNGAGDSTTKISTAIAPAVAELVGSEIAFFSSPPLTLR